MADTKKADALSKAVPLGEMLRRRRIAMDAGDLEAAQRIASGTEQPSDAQYGGNPGGDTMPASDAPQGSDPSGTTGTPGRFKLLKDLLIGKSKGK